NLAGIPSGRWADVGFIAQEMLVNAGRHSGASSCRLQIGIDQDCVSIVAVDNGRGFPFKGHYDHDQLVQRRIGPSTLRERAAFLAGTLAFDWTATGATVQVRVPLQDREPY